MYVVETVAIKALRHEEESQIKVEKARGTGVAVGRRVGTRMKKLRLKKAPDPFF